MTDPIETNTILIEHNRYNEQEFWYLNSTFLRQKRKFIPSDNTSGQLSSNHLTGLMRG